MLNISWTDCQNLTKTYMGTTSECVKEMISFCDLDRIFKVTAEKMVTVCSVSPERISVYKEMFKMCISLGHAKTLIK